VVKECNEGAPAEETPGVTSGQISEVRWSNRALRDLAEIHAYIADDKPTAADRQTALFFRSAEGLMSFPGKGRVGRVDGTRELAVPGTSHIVVYEILDTAIFIIAVLHGARRWPFRFREE
jgi:toxin ParE1/3/4